MINDKADEVIKKLYKSLLSRYQISLEESMKGSDTYLWWCSFNVWHIMLDHLFY